jgi:endonuclease YncB( thermonuclease family)
LLALACLCATACGDPLDRLAEGERGRVAAVLTGGQLRLEDGTEVRLAGVEVPRRGEPAAAEAQAALSRLLGRGEVMLLYGGPRRDGFGRALAQVRTMGRRRWAQGMLLDAGLARVRTAASDRALASEMLEREARARALARGAWASPEWRVLLPEEVEQPGFALVEGRLGSVVRKGGGGAEAALGRSGLQLRVSRNALAEMSAAGAPLDRLPGRSLRVRGRVSRGAGGWSLAVDHPEQIEPLHEP